MGLHTKFNLLHKKVDKSLGKLGNNMTLRDILARKFNQAQKIRGIEIYDVTSLTKTARRSVLGIFAKQRY